MSAADGFGPIFSGRDFLPPAPILRLPKSGAAWMHERVVKSINDFEEDLDNDHEVGARLVSFGTELTFHIEDVGYWGPDMIIFYGMNSSNKKVQLLQHLSQLSVLLVAVDKMQEEPRRIGFRLLQKLEKDEIEEDE